MADLNYTVSVETARAQQNLQRLRDNTDRASRTFDRLKTAIAGVAVGALYRNTLLLSDAIVNMSRATNISVANITAFSQAMAVSGGTADRARDAISDLTKNLGEAAAGSAELQEAFSRAGVSLEEMRTLSEEDIFREVLQGLTEIPDRAQRSATAMRILGESVKGVDLDNLNRQFGITISEVGPYAAAIESAAAAQSSLQANLNNLTQAITNVTQPINDIISAVNISVEAFESFIKVVTALGGSLLILSGGLSKLNSVFDFIARSTRGTRGNFLGLGGAVRDLKQDITGATNSIGRFISNQGKLSTAIKATTFGVARFGVRLLGIVGIVFSVAEAINALIRSVTGFDTFDFVANQVSRATDKLREFLGIARELPETMRGPTADDIREYADGVTEASKQAAEAEKQRVRTVKSAIEEQVKSIQEIVRGHNQANDSIIEQLENTRDMASLTSEQAEYQRTINAFQSQHAQQIESLKEKQRGLNLETEVGRATNAEIERQIAALTERYAEQLPVVQQIAQQIRDQAVAMQEAAAAAEAIKQAQETARDFAISMEESTRDAQRNFDMLNMGNLEKEIFQIENRIRDQVTARVRELQRVLDQTADPAVRAQIQQQIDAIQKSAQDAIDAQSELAKQGYEYQRSWSFGWQKAFRDYQDDATNAAKTAERVFSKATRGMEDAIVGFVKTGKFEWKDFVNSILEELLRAQIQQLIAQIFGAAQPSSLFGGGGAATGGGGGVLSGIGSAIGGLFGGGNQTPSISPGQQNSNAGGGILGGISDILSGNNSVIGSISKGTGIVGSIAKGVGSIFGGGSSGSSGGGIVGGIKDAVSSVGKFFGGFFANGGVIPPGKFGIVGERGPEMAMGPTAISPMGAASITYNINAVDASSFAQLVSRDPGLIYAVTEQGRKSIARRR